MQNYKSLKRQLDQLNLELSNQFLILGINDVEEQYQAIIKTVENSSKTIQGSKKIKGDFQLNLNH